MRRLRAEARHLLHDHLDPPSVPFAEAVVAQVAHPLGAPALDPDAEREVAMRVTALLMRCESIGPDPEAARDLALDPPLLAAFFQNADLLFEHGYPHADTVSMLTLDAMHRADPGPGGGP